MSKVILAVAFGGPSTTSANMHIAKLAQKEAGNCSIVATRNVPLLDYDFMYQYIGPSDPNREYATIKIVKDFAMLLAFNSWDDVCIVSEPIYSVRIERDLRNVVKFFKSDVKISKIGHPADRTIWYDERARLLRNRHELILAICEVFLISIPWEKYLALTE